MRYERPDTAERAAQLLAAEGGIARILAGGTDLLVQMRTDVVEPALVVDIKNINEVRTITRGAGRLSDRGGGDRRRVEGACAADERLARHRRGGQPDRLDAGAGSRDDGR